MVERIFKSDEERERIESFLRKEHFSSKQINNFLGDYTQQDSPFFFEYLNEESTTNISAIKLILKSEKENKSPISREVEDFEGFLKSKKLTMNEGLSIYRYTFYGEEILKLKRSGKSAKDEIKLMGKQLKKSFIKFGKKDILKNYKIINSLIEFAKILNPFEEFTAVQQKTEKFLKGFHFESALYYECINFVYDVMNTIRLQNNITDLDKSLKNQIPYNMVVYRAINPSYLDLSKSIIKNPETLLGQKINQNGYTSTSLRYENSFAKYSQYPLVLKIFVPKGTQGLDISRLSSMPNEEEVLLNSCDLFIFNVSSFVDDKNSKYEGKIYANAVAISKDRKCYKDIGKSFSTTMEVASENS